MTTDVIYTPSGNAGEYANKGYALNLFDGCDHGCRYCYVPQVKHCKRESFHASVKPRKDILKRIEADLAKLGKVDEPIFLCFTCDPCPSQYLVAMVTNPAIDLIHESGNSVRMLTKQPMLGPFTQLREGDEFATTLTLHAADAKLWEPNAERPEYRISALHHVRKHCGGGNGAVKTWVSFEPVIDPQQALELIELAAPQLSFCKIGKANHLGRWNWPSDEWRRRVESIDWHEFANEAVALCQELNLPYYIKNDLRPYLEPGTTPDTLERTAER